MEKNTVNFYLGKSLVTQNEWKQHEWMLITYLLLILVKYES